MVYYSDATQPKAPHDAAAEPARAAPRVHHYRFVHYVLRMVAFARPIDCLGMFAADPDAFLAQLWSMLLDCCPGEDEPDFGPRSIEVHIARVGPYPCAVVRMPEPRHVTEAHFAALIVPVALDELTSPPELAPMRFFTLEHGISFDAAAPRTVICEWTADGAHVNGGDGPEPSLEAFLACVAERLVVEGGPVGPGTR